MDLVKQAYKLITFVVVSHINFINIWVIGIKETRFNEKFIWNG